MKKILSFFSLILVMGACNVLEPDPQTALDANTALADGASANAILNGAYSSMGSDAYYGVEYVLNNDLIADNAIYQGFFDSQLEIDQKAVPFSNLWVSSAWVDIYQVINITNLLVTEVPGLDEANFGNKNQVLGEAHALRAMAYFDLLRVYGEHYDLDSRFGMPLLLEPVENNDFNLIPNLSRSSVSDTYLQINNDIETALSLLTGTDDPGRMNYWATLGLQARVALYQKNYERAFAAADELIQNGPATLAADLSDVYNTLDPSEESIFDLEFNDQDQSAYNTFAIRRDEYNVDESLLNAIEAGDARAAFFGFSRNANRTLKYPDGNNSNNAKIFRLAEIYLIRAEAAAMRSDDPQAGLSDINVIRERAGLSEITSVASMDNFIDVLLQERRIELNYEGHRFFDLVRFDRVEEVLDMPDFRKVFPIPRNELQVSEEGALEQNPGYETL
ncbi:RagB/SusD family nutrient uptake outer membrane protein [Algoriphagus hitonicola]|uniref:Starch-binding associating with outer membrane n=1 Tax=Algoriphagus hitonicola TaxID=435880 RepID=A0A1I2VN39_9BACT|nr:RagB/SusD family nutrient uptake outer membrane protein [Algoriphagus hitonicola]SFG90735.1 Starch-binding associating with outer membrane [Algoriphagus hitonicola]